MSRSIKKFLFGPVLVLTASLFFIGGPDSLALPTISYAWNLGHILFFALLALATNHWKPKLTREYPVQLLLFVLLISIDIELVQTLIGRSLSLNDVYRNLTGFGLALLVVRRSRMLVLLVLPLLFFLAKDLTGFAKTAYSDYLLQQRSPIIEDFEHSATLRQWQGQIELIEDKQSENNRLAQLTFPAKKYSGFYFDSILKDWTGYTQLTFRIHNPYDEEQALVIRLNDEAHERSDQEHKDRFNRLLQLASGWNEVSIPLQDIKQAPADREMDLTQMFRLMLFYGNLEEEKQLLLDDIILK